jgi:hypothetical protein
VLQVLMPRSVVPTTVDALVDDDVEAAFARNAQPAFLL